MNDRAEIFKSLGEPTRLRILERLLKNNACRCVCELSKEFKKDQSVIYRHVQTLERAGLLRTHKEANKLLCCVSDKKRIKRILEVV